MTSPTPVPVGLFARRMPAWIGDLLAVVFVLGGALAPYPGSPMQTGNLVGLIAGVAGALAMPLRRRWPIPVLAACIALFGVVAFSGAGAAGLVVASAIAMFAVAVRNDRRTTVIVAAGTVVAVVGLSLLSTIFGYFDPRDLQFALTIAFAAAAGDAARSHHAYIEAITERAIRAEETRESEARRRVAEDRLRIARDLHDTVAHQISVISLNAGVASSSLESRPETARDALATIRSASRTVLGEIGDLLELLRAESDDAPGTAPQPGLDRLDELIGRFAESGLDVTVRVEGDVGRLPEAVDRVAYRVIQEALTNAHKHGSEHRAHLLVEVATDAARLVVTNPISSAPVSRDERRTPDDRGGHGLLGVRERVASVRGTVESGPEGMVYRLAATLPIPTDGDASPRHPSPDARGERLR
ncbi:sensor histidine kinase [Agromyces albus]|uniref:histidine kinase n=1 Tax=Agromyces albus TaxID=205332 RepID=A0A4Q2L312_9MICO|nr:histidine kinase [Agromyces albus]RXZ71929.1 sensor histidine kinase [Agromyces albus]